MVSLHKINKLVCFATSNRSTSERYSVRKSFYSVAGRAARATLDALATSGVNAQYGDELIKSDTKDICHKLFIFEINTVILKFLFI